MIIVDTSVWVEFLKKKEAFFARMTSLLEDGEILAVECIFGELLQGARNGRERKLIEAYWDNIPKIDEKGLWVEAGQYSGRDKLLSKGVGLIDAAIITAARKTSSQIWTLDKRLRKELEKAESYNVSNGVNSV